MNGVSTIKIKNTTKGLVIEIINADEVSTIDNDLMKCQKPSRNSLWKRKSLFYFLAGSMRRFTLENM